MEKRTFLSKSEKNAHGLIPFYPCNLLNKSFIRCNFNKSCWLDLSSWSRILSHIGTTDLVKPSISDFMVACLYTSIFCDVAVVVVFFLSFLFLTFWDNHITLAICIIMTKVLCTYLIIAPDKGYFFWNFTPYID